MSAGNRVSHGLEDATLDVIRGQPLFHGVGSDGLSALLATADIRNLAAGETLLAPGDGNDRLFVVITGHLVLRVSDDEEAARVLGPGDLAGEVSLIANAPVYSRVIAEDAARVLTIPRATLWRIAHQEPVFTCNLLQYLARQLAGVGSAMRTARALQEEYRQHAHTDPLTGLYNRRWMDERLTFEIARSELRARPLCLMMIDIDHFKPYNDTHGHLAGDLVLQTVAATVRMALRESDLAVRFGGEEVVVILPGTETAEALGVAGRLHRALSGSGYPAVGGTPLPRVTVSIGVAAWKAGDDAVRLIRRADRALYRAKDAGRNRSSL
jgi:diguanylate cyclase (GGDEF)-like protein